jgi:hypothetical protein
MVVGGDWRRVATRSLPHPFQQLRRRLCVATGVAQLVEQAKQSAVFGAIESFEFGAGHWLPQSLLGGGEPTEPHLDAGVEERGIVDIERCNRFAGLRQDECGVGQPLRVPVQDANTLPDRTRESLAQGGGIFAEIVPRTELVLEKTSPCPRGNPTHCGQSPTDTCG